MDKETYRFMYPAGVASLSLVFSHKALQWLCGTTRDDDGRETGNFTPVSYTHLTLPTNCT